MSATKLEVNTAPRLVETGGADIDVVIPVYNEAKNLGHCVPTLHAFLSENIPYTSRITIADNGSEDGTWGVAQELCNRFTGVHAVHLDRKGRGRALSQVWAQSDARIVAYMDVDLSTDLNAFLPLVAPLISGHSDIAIGSRLTHGSNVTRSHEREFISRCYNLLLRSTLRARFVDAQCGFKAMRTESARLLLPHVENTNWFFDTELLVLAQRCRLRVNEIPVDWIEDPDTSVRLIPTALEDLRGILRLLAKRSTRTLTATQLSPSRNLQCR